ncbi:MAG: cupin domain-containing protein [Rikenellaceae bacterium]|nr:cupin domain-containing protein [Rikenellaceae bacterium]
MIKNFHAALALWSVLAVGTLKAQPMESGKSDRIEITETMQPVNPEWFTGTGWIEMWMSDTETFGVSVGRVIFEPGCRNHWHKHPGSQLLIVTEGVGYYQERGKPVQVIRPGDVIAIYPGIEHWHGATPGSWFAHMALGINPEAGPAEWLEPVAEDYYENLNP